MELNTSKIICMFILYSLTIIGLVVFFITLIFSLIVFISCFESISVNNYGLLYNTWSMKLDSEPRSAGRFWLGYVQEFKTFPKQL